MKGDKEVWAPVPGFNGAYEVSSLGAVRSWANGSWGRREVPRAVKLIVDSRGYPKVGLYANGSKCSQHVHVLVLLAFVGPRPLDAVACHANDIRTDNRLANLRWDTRTENWADGMRNGGAVLNGVRSRAKLTREDLKRVKEMFANGKSNREIGRAFNISASRISDIRNGKAYTLPGMEKAS